MAKEHKFQIMELFGPTVQGEGILTGTISHFLRLGGCGLRCSWCDSLYSVIPAEIRKHRTMMTSADIIAAIGDLPWAPYMTLTGGDPCLSKYISDIFPYINSSGTRIAIETQGQEFPDWLMDTDVITFSPKPPSSGNEVDYVDLCTWLVQNKYDYTGLVCIKVVCFDLDDIDYAMGLYNMLPENLYDSFYFTAGSPEFFQGQDADVRTMGIMDSYRELSKAMLDLARKEEFDHKTNIGCQLHAMIWPTVDKGV